MPKSGSESGDSTVQKPSTREVNAAVGDIKTAPSDNLAPAVGAFSKLAAETDDPVAEASVLSILAARKRRGDGPWTASDAAAIKSLVLQVSSTPGRFGAVPTRNVLFSQVCQPEGAFTALIGVHEIAALVPVPGADQKDRHLFVLEWLGNALPSAQVTLIANVTAKMLEVPDHTGAKSQPRKCKTKSKKGESMHSPPAAAKADTTASPSCAAFFTVALQSSNEACRLSVLSSFGHLVVACAQHPQPASRKLSVKLVEAWLEFVNGIATPGSTSLSNSSSTDTGPKIGKTSAESSVRILATIAVEDSDAGVQVAALEAIASSNVVNELIVAPATFVKVFRLVVQLAAHRKLPITVKDKAFHALAKFVTAAPFRDVMLKASTEAGTASTAVKSTAIKFSTLSSAANDDKFTQDTVEIQGNSAHVQWHKLPPDDLVFIHTLRAVVKPMALTTLPHVLFASEHASLVTSFASTTASPSTSVAAAAMNAPSHKGKVVAPKPQAGNRMQARILTNCITLLSDPLIPLEPNDFLQMYTSATTSPQNCFENVGSSSLCAKSMNSATSTITAAPAALAVLQEVFERRGGGVTRLLALGRKVLVAHLSKISGGNHVNKGGNSSIDDGLYSSASDKFGGSTPLHVLIGRLARPFVNDLIALYLTTQNQGDVGDYGALGDAMVALFCVTEAANLGSIHRSHITSTLSDENSDTNGDAYLEKAIIRDLLNAVLSHLEDILHYLVRPIHTDDATIKQKGGANKVEEVDDSLHERQSCIGSNSSEVEDCVGNIHNEHAVGEEVIDSTSISGNSGGDDKIEGDAIASNSGVGTSEQDLTGFDENGFVIGGGPVEQTSDTIEDESERSRIVTAQPVPASATMDPVKPTSMHKKKKGMGASSLPLSNSVMSTAAAAAYQLACALARLLPHFATTSSRADAQITENAQTAAKAEKNTSDKSFQGPYGAIVARIHRSVVFSPLGGGAALIRLPGLQRPLIHIAQCLPDPQRAIFGLFATAFEEAFNDRFETTCPPSTSMSSAEHECARVKARCSAVVGALQALGQICEETASTISTRVKHKFEGASTAAVSGSSRHASSNATTTCKDREGLSVDEEDGGADFYLKDLVRQQQCEEEVNRQVSDAVNGNGFLACYRSLVEALVLDHEAPTATRIAALNTLGSYCAYAPTLARQWGSGFLAIAEDANASPELRATAVGVWGRLGPQVANEELRVCALIRSSEASTRQNGYSKDYPDGDFVEEDSEFFNSALHATTSGSTGDGDNDFSAKPPKFTKFPSHISTQDIPVRCTAVRVLAHLIAGERVKARRCLCRIAEGLIDSHGSVVAAATSALRQALSEDKHNKNNGSNQRTASGSNQQNSKNKGAALLFEVAFSAELPEQKRQPVAAALLKVLKQIQAPLAGLSVAVAREVTQKPSENAPALLLALLPPSPNSVAMLHEALVRGILRTASTRILRAVQEHLAAEVLLVPDGTNFLDTKRGTKGGNVAPMTSSGKSEETPEAAAAAARSMVGDLLRTATTVEDNQAKKAFKCNSKGANESESECSDKESDGKDGLNTRAKSQESSRRRSQRGKRRSRAESVSSDDFEVEYTPPSSARPSFAKGILAEPVDIKEALLRFKRERLEKQRAQTPLDGNKKKKREVPKH